jgi:hypothetical protein
VLAREDGVHRLRLVSDGGAAGGTITIALADEVRALRRIAMEERGEDGMPTKGGLAAIVREVDPQILLVPWRC